MVQLGIKVQTHKTDTLIDGLIGLLIDNNGKCIEICVVWCVKESIIYIQRHNKSRSLGM